MPREAGLRLALVLFAAMHLGGAAALLVSRNLRQRPFEGTSGTAVARAAVPEVACDAETVSVFGISDLHCDYAENRDWVDRLERPEGDGHNALVVGGALRLVYDDVFFVPGNHEAWLSPAQRVDAAVSSLDKLAEVRRIAEAERCSCAAARLVDRQSRGVTIAPMLSWYHSSHDVEPDDDLDEAGAADRARFQRGWADFGRCRWPEALVGATRRHSMADATDRLARHLGTYNDVCSSVDEEGPVVSFSHFSPRVECIPEKRFLLHPSLAKVAGSDPLGEQVAALKPAVHLFGHTHIPIDLDLDATFFVQWPLGSPREQRRQCRRSADHGPLHLFSTARGVLRPEPRTAWGTYYSLNKRDPTIKDLAPWVLDYRRKGGLKKPHPAVSHAGSEDAVVTHATDRWAKQPPRKTDAPQRPVSSLRRKPPEETTAIDTTIIDLAHLDDDDDHHDHHHHDHHDHHPRTPPPRGGEEEAPSPISDNSTSFAVGA